MEEYRAKNRSARVVTTDKLDKPAITAIETQPPAPAAAPGLPPPVAATPAAPATGAVIPPAQLSQPPKSAPAPSPVVALGTPAPNMPAPAEAPEAASPQPGLLAPPPAQTPPASAKSEAKQKRLAQKAQRKSRYEPRAPAKQDVDDDGGTFASADPDEGAFEERNSGRSDRRSRRIVERWTERDYDVPDSRGGRRQVTVIRRNNGGGLFESLFGN